METSLLAFFSRHGKFLVVSHFFKPNISRHGRLARGVIGALCLVAGIVVAGDYSLWGLILVVAGLFAQFEAIRGWCVVRACGIKTKL
jgi:Inner membrane protein YgaP-like, transmembrane domain